MAENEACLLEVSEKFCLTYDLEKGNMPLTPGHAAQIGTCLKVRMIFIEPLARNKSNSSDSESFIMATLIWPPMRE